jgi:hypothetical protein
MSEKMAESIEKKYKKKKLGFLKRNGGIDET